MTSRYSCSLYLIEALVPPRRKLLLERCAHALLAFRNSNPFDTLAVSGVSGLLVGPELASTTNSDLVVVRKEDDLSTHGQAVEGPRAVGRYVFVDDIISSGKTFLNVLVRIQGFSPGALCKGVLLYERGEIAVTPALEMIVRCPGVLTEAVLGADKPFLGVGPGACACGRTADFRSRSRICLPYCKVCWEKECLARWQSENQTVREVQDLP